MTVKGENILFSFAMVNFGCQTIYFYEDSWKNVNTPYIPAKTALQININMKYLIYVPTCSRSEMVQTIELIKYLRRTPRETWV